jgi:hypothetical protein
MWPPGGHEIEMPPSSLDMRLGDEMAQRRVIF